MKSLVSYQQHDIHLDLPPKLKLLNFVSRSSVVCQLLTYSQQKFRFRKVLIIKVTNLGSFLSQVEQDEDENVYPEFE